MRPTNELTVSQAAAKRRVSRFTIDRWIRSGLKCHWIGPIRMIYAADLARWKPRPPGNPNPANNGAAKRRRRSK